MKKAANPISIGIATGCSALWKNEVPLLQSISDTRRNIHNIFGPEIEGHCKFMVFNPFHTPDKLYGKRPFDRRR